MKKFFTLFMATVVAMSMMAVPQVKKVGKKVNPTSKEQFEAKTPAQAKTLELAKDAKVLRSVERAQDMKKLPASHAPLKVAAAQAADTVELHFDAFAVVPEYYEEDGDWYMSFSANGWIVKFDIVSSSYVGTFTEEDLLLDYSYIIDPYDNYVDYVKAEVTISETTVSQHLTVLSLHAVIDGTDGAVYVVTCDHQFLTPKSELSHVVGGATLEFDGEKFVLAGKNDDLDVNLAVWATWPTGPFTQGEFDMEATSVVYNGVTETLLNAELLVATDLVDGSVAYTAELSYYNQDTVLNHVSITAPVAPATDTVEISISNLQVDDSWAGIFGWVYLTGTNSEYDIYGGVTAFEAEEGEWAGLDEVMLYVTNLTTGEATEIIYGQAEMVNDDEKGWMVLLEGHCTDGKYYIVDMHFEIPEPTETVTLRFENSAKASFYPDMGNDLMLSNDNGDYYVSLDIYNVPMGGEFTLDNMDSYYTQLIDWNEYVELQIADVKGSINQYGDTTVMKAEVICFNAVLYDIELWHVAPEPTEVVELTIDATFTNELENSGYYTLSGTPAGSDLIVSLSPITEEVAGTFVNDGVFGRFGAEGGQYDFYATETYVAKPNGVDEYGDPDYEVWGVEKGTLVVELADDGTITATASIICSNAVQYNITMTSTYDIPHLDYDAEIPVEKAYTAADILTAEYDESYGMALVQVGAADGSDLCAVYFFIEETDEDIVIPAGTYTIDDSWDYGTVLASEGYDEYSGQVAPSLYATCNEEGYLMLPMWFMVGGSVTVEKVDDKMKMEINAVNSYNQPIHITYDGTITGVENINVNVEGIQKQMINGQLYIIRNGEAYNVAGVRVK